MSKTPCKVVPIKNGLYRRRVGTEPVFPGVMLYYLWHEETKLFWNECYVNEGYAIAKAAVTMGPTSMSDVAQSWVPEPKYCKHSHRTKED